jgi:predicted kinase
MLVVLVNGLPGAGKTTLARTLAQALALPLFAKDAIKETAADILGSESPDARTQREWNQSLGAAATEVIWTLVGLSRVGAVIETPLLADVRHYAEAGLRRAGVALAGTHEVWCDVPAVIARKRFEARAAVRHPIHGTQTHSDEQWARWEAYARPLGFGFVHRVDTTGPVDVAALVTAIRAARRH